MKKIIVFLLFLSVNFFVFSQSADDSEIKTIRFQEDENGYIQFFTNDPAYSASLVTDGSPEENKIGHCVNLGGSFRLFPEGYVDIRYKIKEA